MNIRIPFQKKTMGSPNRNRCSRKKYLFRRRQ